MGFFITAESSLAGSDSVCRDRRCSASGFDESLLNETIPQEMTQ
jgi:hypothetical protein